MRYYHFPNGTPKNKIYGSNLIQHELLLQVQNGESNCTGPGLFPYYKGMPVYLLANQCNPLGIINGIRAIVYRIVPHPNSKKILF